MVADVAAKPTQQFHWRTQYGVPKGLKAEDAAAIFGSIVDRDGALTAPAVVDVAQPEDSPLHPAFEWNDEAAADSFRLAQAGQLMRSLVIVHRKPDGAMSAPVRAYVRVRDITIEPESEDEIDPDVLRSGRYISATRAMETASMRERLLVQAANEISWWRRKYTDLDEFAKIFDIIDAGDVPTAAQVQQIVNNAKRGSKG